MNTKSFSLNLILLAIVIVSCQSEEVEPIPDIQRSYTYQTPIIKDDGWQIDSLSNVDMDTSRIITMMNVMLNNTSHGIHSILIARHNKLVFEEYFTGKDLYEPIQYFNAQTLHCLCSVTKSITSALFGIAMQNDFITSEEDSVYKYFPEYDSLFTEDKKAIQIRHLLTLSSGIEWDESSYSFTDPRNDLINFNTSDDPILYLLSKQMIATPGTRFNYSGGDINLLGEIIARSTGMGLDAFAREYLFKPLGINRFKWLYLENNITYASGDLHLLPRDMAKIGQLYLNKGIWNKDTIISEDYILKSCRQQALNISYGYNWWINNMWSIETPCAYAGGWGGQFIFIFKEIDMVIVFTGGNFNTDHDTPVFSRVNSFILDSVNKY